MKQHRFRLISIALVSIVASLVAGVWLSDKEQPEPRKAVTITRPFTPLAYLRLNIPQAYQNPDKRNHPPSDPYMTVADTVVDSGGQAQVELQIEGLSEIKVNAIDLFVKNLNEAISAPALIEKQVPLPEQTTVKQGQTLRTEATIAVPKQPGYYIIEAVAEVTPANSKAKTVIGSGGSPYPTSLYVPYNPATLRSGTIEVNKSIMVNKHQFTVKKITMGPQATEISINLSHPLMANGLPVKLLDQNGHELQNLKITSNLGGNGNDTFRFGPVPKTVTRLSFVVLDVLDQLPSQSGKSEGGGPWRVDIPLP